MKKVPKLQKLPSISREQGKFILLLLILAISSLLLFMEIILPPVPALALPPPDTKGSVPLSTAIYQSRIIENLGFAEIGNNSISQLLWSLQGLTHGPNYRTVPSAGATYPLEIYFYHKGTSSLEEGTYHYLPLTHRIERLSKRNNFDLLLSATTSPDRDALVNVSTIFTIFADYSRTTGRYGTRGIRYVHLETGHAIQNFFLQATAINLQVRPVTSFIDENVQVFFNSTLTPLMMLPTGKSQEMNAVKATKKKTAFSIVSDEMTVEQAIAKRASIRDYIEGEIPSTILLEILADSCKIPFLAGNISNIDIRVVTGDVTGLAKGNYLYVPEVNSLSLVTAGDMQDSLYDVSLEQPWISAAQLDIIISINTNWVNQQSDPVLYERILLFNVGMIAQNIYHKCSAHGLGTVVVGAFYDSLVASLLDIQDSFNPVYEMPVGLTPVFFEEEGFLQLTELARLVGILVFIPFYLNFYLSIPILRGRIPRKLRRWIHCGLAVIPLIGAIIHFMIIHGFVRQIWDFFSPLSYFSVFFKLLTVILSVPLTRYDLGLFLAVLGISSAIISSLMGFLLLIKRFSHKRTAKRVHKYGLFLSLVLLVSHGILNRVFFPYSQLAFILIHVIAVDVYFILQTVPRVKISSEQLA